MRLNCVLVLCKRQLQNAAFCKENSVFTPQTNKNVQRFWKGLIYEFYGLKASQISKAHASSHEHPHVEKIRQLCIQNFNGGADNMQLDSSTKQLQ